MLTKWMLMMGCVIIILCWWLDVYSSSHADDSMFTAVSTRAAASFSSVLYQLDTWSLGEWQQAQLLHIMCSGSEASSLLMLEDFVYHSTQRLRVIKKKKEWHLDTWCSSDNWTRCHLATRRVTLGYLVSKWHLDTWSLDASPPHNLVRSLLGWLIVFALKVAGFALKPWGVNFRSHRFDEIKSKRDRARR